MGALIAYRIPSLLLIVLLLWAWVGSAPAAAHAEPGEPVPGLRVAVVDAWTGQPLSSAVVGVLFSEWFAYTDQAGVLDSPELPPDARLFVVRQGYLPALLTTSQRPEITVRLLPRRLSGRVLELGSRRPIAGAWVHVGDQLTRTDEEGRFSLLLSPPAPGAHLMVRAAGYARGRWVLGEGHLAPVPAWDAIRPLAAEQAGARMQAVACPDPPCVEFELAPFPVRAFYIPLALLHRPQQVEALLDLAQRSPVLNGVVVDVKGDGGRLAWPSEDPVALAVGAYQHDARRISLEEFIRMSRARELYVIARMVLFKDAELAAGKPEWAIQRADGTLWTDNRGTPWMNPFLEEAWAYPIALAREVAALGVDEIQLDYVRFPSDGPLEAIRYPQESTLETRTTAIRRFVERFARAVRPLGAFTAADVFGLTVWVVPEHDMGIGQRVMDIAPWVDYLSPMVYPSTFIPGNLGLDDPKAYPYEVVYRSVQQAMKRVPPGTRVRPWLQAYGYSLAEMWLQRYAAENAQATGWMFWNAGGVYPPELFGSMPDLEAVRAMRAPEGGAAHPEPAPAGDQP